MDGDLVADTKISSKKNIKDKLLIICLLAVIMVSSFTGGYLVKEIFSVPQPPVDEPLQKPTGQPTNMMNYLPGYRYYEDGFYINIDDPNKTSLIASVGRIEQPDGIYSQQTRISRLDKIKPIRVTADKVTKSPAVGEDEIIKEWITIIDKSRVVKEVNKLEFKVKDTSYKLDTGVLTNEVVVRSLPGYTKFLSAGSGLIEIDGKKYSAQYVFYRIFSLNSKEILVYQNNLGINTDLGVLWDEKNRVIFFDVTEVDKPIATYAPHKIGFLTDPAGIIKRTFDIVVEHDEQIPPKSYRILLQKPVNSKLELTSGQFMDKTPGEAYSFYLLQVKGLAEIDGEAASVSGIMEYIID